MNPTPRQEKRTKHYAEIQRFSVTEALLYDILATLEEMKEQERDYWETWKQKKEKELA